CVATRPACTARTGATLKPSPDGALKNLASDISGVSVAHRQNLIAAQGRDQHSRIKNLYHCRPPDRPAFAAETGMRANGVFEIFLPGPAYKLEHLAHRQRAYFVAVAAAHGVSLEQ